MQEVVGSTPILSTKIKGSIKGGLFLFMSFIVYILYSARLDQYYIGHTANIEDRLTRHNNSGSKSTKKTNDWKPVYTEVFESKAVASKREAKIKKKKSRQYIQWLISSSDNNRDG